MKKVSLLKTMLLLFALIAGSSSAWAQKNVVFSEDFTTNKTTALLEAAGWTLDGKVSMNGSKLNGTALQVASGQGSGSAKTPTFSSLTNSTATLTFNIASSGSATNTLTITGNNCKVNGGASTTASTADGSVTIELSEASTSSSITFSATAGCVIDDIEVYYMSGPSYTITALSNNDEWGTVSGTYTITATPASGYRVSTSTPYTVSPAGSATVEQEGNIFTVTPSANTTITINFEAIPQYTISYSVNGTIVDTKNVLDGNAIDLSAPGTGIPAGYVFTGWSEVAILTPQATAPGYVTSATCSGDKTFYAVIARSSGDTPSTLTKMVAGDDFAIGDKIVIVADVDDSHYGLYQETIGGSYVKYYTFSESVATVAGNDKNWLTVAAGTTSGKWKLGDATNGYLYSSGSNNLSISTDSYAEWALEDNDDGTFSLTQGRYLSCRNDLTGEHQYRYRLAGSSPNGTYKLSIYKYVEGEDTYSDFCTTIPPVAAEINATYEWATFCSSAPLDFTGTGVDAYIVTGFEGDAVVKTQVYKVPANTGLLLNGATDNIPVYGGEDFDDVSANQMVAVTTAETISAVSGKTRYVLADEGGKAMFLSIGATDADVPAGKAYLEIDGDGARALNLDGETTAIQSIDNGQLTKDNVIYDLSGRRVENPTKGIFIMNGKKFVVK